MVWGVWRAVLSLWGYLIWRLGLIGPDAGREWLHGIRPATEGIRAALVDIWLRWDTVHYVRIIQDGYGPDERSAFFPLYPFLGKAFNLLSGGDEVLGLLVASNLAAIGSFALLDHLSQSVEPHPILKNLVFYPSAFFLLVAYPQSLVLFFSLAAYVSQRKRLIGLTFLLGLAAGLTHPTAISLSVLLFINALGFKRQRWPWLLVALAPMLGMGAFMAWRIWSGYPSFQVLLSSIWGKTVEVGVDLTGMMTARIWLARGWPNLLALLLGIGAFTWSYKRKLYDWLGFLAALLIIPILTAPAFEPLAGLGRYALAAFPVYFAISTWLPGGWKRVALLALAIGANLYLSGLFVLWGFIG